MFKVNEYFDAKVASIAFQAETKPKLQAQLDKLTAFLDGRTQQLEMELGDNEGRSAAQQTQRLNTKEQKLREIQKTHDDYKRWIQDTMQTEDSPSIRLFAVFGNFDK